MESTTDTDKEYKRTALLMALIFLMLVMLMLLLMSFVRADPPFSSEQLEMVELDFSGGGSTEGAVSETNAEETSSSMDQPDDPVETYDDPESPVEESSDPVSDGTSDNETEEPANNPSNDFSNVFGNGTGNTGTGTDSDGNDGTGTGTGPNIGPGTGAMGSGRKLVSKPKAENEIDDIGKVLVKIFVKKDGSVDPTRTKVLHNDPKTTSPHKYHWDTARKLANQYKFEPVTSGHKLQYITITITFTSG